MACPCRISSTTSKTKLQILRLLYLSTVAITTFTLTLLALDVFTLPYLTPFAHTLRDILHPLLPFLAPLFLGILIKFCSVPAFPKQKLWMFISFSWFFQQIQRVVGDGMGLVKSFSYDPTGKTGLDGIHMTVCGLDDCGTSWLEYAMIALVIIGEIRGWKWEGGVVDKWIAQVVKKSWEEEREKLGGEAGEMENGVVGVDVKEEAVWIDEKEALIEEQKA